MIIETFFYNKIAKKQKDNNCDTYKMSYMAFVMTKIITMSIALYLSWKCNKNNKSIVIRSLFILFAFLFSDAFIIYYIIYYLIMKNKCE